MTTPYLVEIIDDAQVVARYTVNLAEATTDEELDRLNYSIEGTLGGDVWVSIEPLTFIPNLVPVRDIPSFIATHIVSSKESN